MPDEKYSSSDIWLCAVFLCLSDAKLIDFQVSHNGRRTVMFTFCGKGLSRIAQQYCDEQIQTNVVQLRARLNFLRDVIFQSKENC